MSKYHCYLCASDEGMLLDIFGDGGKTLRENIETCLSVKIKQSDAPSTKICHKCAWELDCCGKFVQRYKQSRDIKESRASIKQGNCILCFETEKKNHILVLKKGNALNNFECKIHELFSENFLKGKSENLCICLDCRYNVDVLFDLKNIYRTTPEKLKNIVQNGVELSDLPKTRTRIVNRNTTETPLPTLNGDFSYDSDTSMSSTMSTKRKRGRPRTVKQDPIQFRTCEECATCVEHGIDMYRYHRTGLIVCRDCWLKMDPENMTNRKRKTRNNTQKSTKLCAVFLKDVLSNPSKYKNLYKMEKDEHGNTTFLITDDSSENDEKDATPPKRSRDQSSLTSLETKKPIKRVATTNNETEPAKRSKGKIKLNSPETSNSQLRTKNEIAHSETSTTTATTRTRRTSVQSATSAKSNQDSDPSTIKKTGKKSVRVAKRGKSVSPSEKSPIRSSNENTVLSTKRRTRSSSFTSQETIPLTNRLTALPENEQVPKETELPEVKTKRVKRILPAAIKNAKSDSELEKPYTCAVCGIGYKNKLIGMAHQLTHAKQPEVKLERVIVPEIVVKAASAELVTIEEPEEQSHDVSNTSDHKHEPDDVPNVVTIKESTPEVVEDRGDQKDLEVEKSRPEVVEVKTKKEDSEEEKFKLEVTESSQDKEDSEKELREKVKETSKEKEDSETEKSRQKITEIRTNEEDSDREKTMSEVDKVSKEKEYLKEKTDEEDSERTKTIPEVKESSEEKENLNERSEPEVTEMSEEKGLKEAEARMEVVNVSEDKEDAELRVDVMDVSEDKGDADENEEDEKGNESRPEVTEVREDKNDLKEEKLRREVTQVNRDKGESEGKELSAIVTEMSEEKVNSEEEKSPPEISKVRREKENSDDEKSRPKLMEVSIEKEDSEDDKSRPEVTKISKTEDQLIESENSPLPESKSPKTDETFDHKKSNESNEDKETEEASEKLEENSIVEGTQNTEESTRIEENIADMIDEIQDKMDENENKENDEVTKKESDENKNSTESLEEKALESSAAVEVSEIENKAEKSEFVHCENTEKITRNVESSEEIESIEISANGDVADLASTEPEAEKIATAETEIEVDAGDLNVTMVADLKERTEILVDSRSQGEKNDENSVKDKIIVLAEVTHDKTGDKSLEIERNEKIENTNVTETDETKIAENSKSLDVVPGILKEVFDLANAEVKKRLEKARSNDETSATPISETLENISREIQDGADMPSLGLDDQSRKVQS